MRSFVLMFVLVLGFGPGLWAQTDVRQDLKRLDLTEVQMQQVNDVVRSSQLELEKNRAEARIAQAQLARLLLEDNPAKSDMEKLVRQGLEWDFKIKMLRIDRSLKIRAIVGKERWASLSNLSQKMFDAERQGKHPQLFKDGDRPVLKDMLQMLKDLN